MDVLAQIKRQTSAKLNDRGVARHKQGDLKGALQLYSMAISVDPGCYPGFYNLGNLMRSQHKFEAALSAYERAMACAPDFIDAWRNAAPVYRHLGRHDEARRCYEKMLAADPEDRVARHFLDAMDGKSSGAPPPYVEELFDGCATGFDEHLVGRLHYRVPAVLMDLVRERGGQDPVDHCLDLGCGTGLLAAPLRGICRQLVGVDVSKNMLVEAEKKELYDELVHCDIVEYLRGTPQTWGLVIVCDVLLYLGDLAPLFEELQQRTESGAQLLISVDVGDLAEGFALQPSGRYCHSRSYVEELCRDHGLNVVDVQTEEVRRQDEERAEAVFFRLGRAG